eukprot:jgi/Mesen1/7947/ME000422S07104
MPSNRRPIDYPYSAGWQGRILQGTALGAGLGLAGGAVTGVIRGANVGACTAAVGTNCAIAAFTIYGAQELVRELRAAHPDDLINSALGGLFAGALLGRLHGGVPRAVTASVLFGAAAAGLHLASIEFQAYRLRSYLHLSREEQREQVAVSLPAGGLREGSQSAQGGSDAAQAATGTRSAPPGSGQPGDLRAGSEGEDAPPWGSPPDAHSRGRKEGGKGGRETDTWQWPEWLPIRRLGDEEAAKRAEEKEAEFRRRVQAALQGKSVER